ncbi:YppG family protein [Aquibacillus salsiterrae]|uniref:YppG family protein n=1 Tax=Aquibacillus salsiterrae TaxID=2950439 RepID=A0A9X4AEW7_9BACI|nr:YppG family protein [Aquibacillus salsiterrae]MDC3417039.1 YppG family protein [Aquibacillus salsiterrae]
MNQQYYSPYIQHQRKDGFPHYGQPQYYHPSQQQVTYPTGANSPHGSAQQPNLNYSETGYPFPSYAQQHTDHQPYAKNQANQQTSYTQQPIQQQPPRTPFGQFARPKQPINYGFQQPVAQSMPPFQGGLPYPGPMGKKRPGLMSIFKDENGKLDMDKMFNTVGQVTNTYHQVYPLLKGLGSFVKGFK